MSSESWLLDENEEKAYVDNGNEYNSYSETPKTIIHITLPEKGSPTSTSKCGEVFLGYHGNFIFVCTVCMKQYDMLEDFGSHIHDCHDQFSSAAKCDTTRDDFMETNHDPLQAVEHYEVVKEEIVDSLVKLEESVIASPERCSYSLDIKEESGSCLKITDGTRTTYSCKVCMTSYLHHKSYLAHARKVHGILTKTMMHKLCWGTREATQNDNLVENQRVISWNNTSAQENSSRAHSCMFCPRSYKHRRSLRFHIRTEHEHVLDRFPSSQLELLSPIEVADTEDSSSNLKFDQEYRCNFCNRIYRHKRSLLFHIKIDHATATTTAPDNGSTCKYCDKQFDSMELLETHIEKDHPGHKKFVCPHCPKTFKCRAARLEHINSHTGDRPYKCTYCSKGFTNSSNLAVHIRMHLQIKKHSCSFCVKRFVSSSEKKRHERTHTGEKLHQCEECGKQYASRNKLTDHLRRHKNIKNYKCEVCDKAFFNLSMLKDHMLSHSQDRPFSCEVCGHSFPRKRALKVHEQLHSDVKKYVCSTCGKAFAQCAGLYSHRKSHGVK